jgi:hypothetical protein
MNGIEETLYTVYYYCGASKTVKAVWVPFFEVLVPQYRPRDTIVLWLKIPFPNASVNLLCLYISINRSRIQTLWPWGSVVLIARHPRSAKVGTNFAGKRRSFCRYISLVDSGHGIFLTSTIKIMAVGIRCADRAIPSIRKSWH